MLVRQGSGGGVVVGDAPPALTSVWLSKVRMGRRDDVDVDVDVDVGVGVAAGTDGLKKDVVQKTSSYLLAFRPGMIDVVQMTVLVRSRRPENGGRMVPMGRRMDARGTTSGCSSSGEDLFRAWWTASSSRRGSESVGVKLDFVPSGRIFCSTITTPMRAHVTIKVPIKPYIRVRIGRFVGFPLSI